MSHKHEMAQRAMRIGRAIQEFLHYSGLKGARSTDVYPYLVKKGLIEADRHQGYQFRKFLLQLKDEGMLPLIPQCTHTVSKSGYNEWFFNLASEQRAQLENLQPSDKKAAIVHQPEMPAAAIDQLLQLEMPNVEKLPARDTADFTPPELELRKSHPRAYEYWTKEEIDILKRTYIATKHVYKVAQLLSRQPHIVEEKLREFRVL